ncbi:APC family permease [Streptomyces sp. NPDC002795]|uniref:APC family permease n=1 Tax=Streptomyces sp. NPDC002795 TaxID=3364665 RepID=UPI0036C4F6A6
MAAGRLAEPTDTAPPRTTPAEGGRLGTASIVFFVVAASAPLTVAAGGLPQSLAVTGVLGQPLIYLGLAAVLMVFGSGYAAMSRRISGAGAFYAYIAAGLGRATGTGAAFVALLAYNAMQVGIAGLFGFTTADFIRAKAGVDVPWWAILLVTVVVVGVLGFLRIDLNARVLVTLLSIETLTVLVFNIAEIVTTHHPLSTEPFTWDAVTTGGVGSAACFAIAGFMGFESGAIYGQECRDPRRTVPRATYLAVALIGVFYAFTSWAMVVGTGTDNAVPMSAKYGPDLLFVLSRDSLGGLFADFAHLFLITSMLAALISFHNAVARYFQVLGQDRVLPARLGRTHPRFGSPYMGSLAQSALAAVVVIVFAALGLDPVATLFTWLTNVGAMGVILLLAATSFSVIAYFRRHDASGTTFWSRALAPLVSGVVLAAVFVMIWGNFPVLLGTEGGSPLSWILPGLVILCLVVGVAYGLVLKVRRPEVYAVLARGGADEVA